VPAAESERLLWHAKVMFDDNRPAACFEIGLLWQQEFIRQL